ncbi:MAG: class I SAM-dependent methyltransferase [Pseudomonadota bacterium]
MNVNVKRISVSDTNQTARSGLNRQILSQTPKMGDLSLLEPFSAQYIRNPPYTLNELKQGLEQIATQFNDGSVFQGMATLRDTLLLARANMDPELWLEAIEIVETHPISDLLRQCPTTNRSVQKPRGYAGDARLIDYIYGTDCDTVMPHAATIAGQVSFFVTHSSACWAVRERRKIIAAEIEKAVSHRNDVRLLSIACGHLRELDLLNAPQKMNIAQFNALDQDESSLAVAKAAAGEVPITAINQDIMSLIRNRTTFDRLDLVYASGLFDYLSDRTATRLIEKSFNYLRSGGKLLIGNFTPYGPDIGYMEACMAWPLIYRTPEDFRSLFNTLRKDQVADIETFTDSRNIIAYVVAEKK